MLHHDKQMFEQMILRTSSYLGVKAEIVEKDYFVTLFLKKLTEIMPEIVFKGGTSLSKCYHVIQRFSEDIDLNLQADKKPSESQRKRMKSAIIQVIEELQFQLMNPEDVRSRREYNRYMIDYPSSVSADYLKEHLIVETAIYQRAYPTRKMKADSLIYQFLTQNRFDKYVEQYDLHPFELNVQTAERTMIDKIYALADYYLLGTTAEHSRHIYDIYKLSDIVEVNESLKELAVSVAEKRKSHKMSLSVQDGVKTGEVLRHIIADRIYEDDYEQITKPLLFEDVSYQQAIAALENILQSGLFD